MIRGVVGIVSLAAALGAGGPAAAQMIIAHRGASFDAPENTLAAFRLGFEQGADAVECDLHLSKDNRIVCIHDADTKRVANVNLVVRETTFDELRKLDVGQWKGPEFRGERMPTLDEIIETVPEGKKIVIELKVGPEIVGPMLEAIDASSLEREQIIVISFQAPTIAEVERRRPELTSYWLVRYKKDNRGRLGPTVDEVARTLDRIRTDGLNTQADRKVVDAEFLDQLCAAGHCKFAVWTVDDVRVARYYQRLGALAITTNRPGWLRQQLAKQAEKRPAAAAAR